MICGATAAHPSSEPNAAVAHGPEGAAQLQREITGRGTRVVENDPVLVVCPTLTARLGQLQGDRVVALVRLMRSGQGGRARVCRAFWPAVATARLVPVTMLAVALRLTLAPRGDVVRRGRVVGVPSIGALALGSAGRTAPWVHDAVPVRG